MSASAIPLYAQIEDALVARITSVLHPGDRLPTEDQLIDEFGVSRITVRRAVQNLVARGLVVTRPGRGAFVTAPKLRQPLTELTGFVEDMEAHGLAATARVLRAEEITAPPEVCTALELPAGSTVMLIERVRLANGTPISFDRTHLPLELGRRVAEEDLANEPIFDVLEQRLATPLREASYALQAVAADAGVAELLEMRAGDAVFRIERTSYTDGGRPVDHEVLHYRGETITFTTRLPRRPTSPDAAR
ncbi:GntR family transcriptional regulator [Microbacterium sp. MYb62]|uniref:GntR family transcriptional regulator n=1 Tax=Microbacterium sp. MYb62 TaxID=1848690 RepID=UPI001C61554C|nr:GntR family transcriptional regulator [Microbacterium sp. MYb62]